MPPPLPWDRLLAPFAGTTLHMEAAYLAMELPPLTLIQES